MCGTAALGCENCVHTEGGCATRPQPPAGNRATRRETASRRASCGCADRESPPCPYPASCGSAVQNLASVSRSPRAIGSRGTDCRRHWRMASSRASSSGRSGTLNGSRVMITFCKASPGTSTPCQKLSTPNSTDRGLSLNSSSIRLRGSAVGLAVERQVLLGQPGGQCGRRPFHHLVAGKQHERPAVAPRHVAADHVDRRPLVPAASLVGSGMPSEKHDLRPGGDSRRGCPARASPFASARSATGKTRTRHCRPPVASVALVMIAVGTWANRCSRRIGPTSIGAAASVIRKRLRLKPRSIQ